MIKLYGSYTSPYVRHCRIALMEAKLDFELIATDQSKSAALVATQRVPFLEAEGLSLSDSASILRFIREKQGKDFLPELLDLEHFCLVNTLLDAAANVFYLEKFGLNPSSNDYVKRQNARIQSGLKELDKLALSFKPEDDVSLRLACFLDWATFRQRVDFSSFNSLCRLLEDAKQYTLFINTPPTE